MQSNDTDPRYDWNQSSERFIPAIVLIGLGVLFFLNNLNIVPVHDVIRFWPAIFIAVGVVQLVDSHHPAGRVVGGTFLGVGAVLLARNLGYLNVRIHDLWPLILIGAGILMLLNRTGLWNDRMFIRMAGRVGGGEHFRRWRDREYVPGMLNEYAVFGGGKRKVNTLDFKGGRVDAVFGGFEIDLREAVMAGDAAVLEANAVFGGIEIRIPVSWSAVVQGVGVFGGYGDETTQPNPAFTPNPKRLIVKGGAVFGGVEVKN